MSGKKRKAKGTTLIEVSLVVATIGLLVSVFVPTLTQAREQARVAKCLQNLRSITQAAASYIQENGTIVFAFPFDYHIDGEPANSNLATEFIWGGGVPDRKKVDWDDSQGAINPADIDTDTYFIRPADRPLNEYVVPGVWWSDPDRLKHNATRRRRPMLLPDVFQCPSDSTAQLPMAGATDSNLPEPSGRWYPTWQWWGTSYAVNWYWAYHYSEAPGYPSFFNVITSTSYGQALFQQKADRGASEFILFYENRLNFAFESARPRSSSPDIPLSMQGWHREQDVHVAGFLDGSARCQPFDTRYIDGPGWTLWPNRPWNEYWEAYQDY